MANEKGIVLEKGNGWAYILFPDGRYEKIKTNDYLEVGDYYVKPDKRSPFKYVAAAVIILVMAAGVIDFFMVQAYAQVVPGIELGINRWNRVIDVKTADNDATAVADKMNLKGKSSEEAVRLLIINALSQDKQELYFEVKVKGNSELEKRLQTEVKTVLKNQAENRGKSSIIIHQERSSFKVKPSFRQPDKGETQKGKSSPAENAKSVQDKKNPGSKGKANDKPLSSTGVGNARNEPDDSKTSPGQNKQENSSGKSFPAQDNINVNRKS